MNNTAKNYLIVLVQIFCMPMMLNALKPVSVVRQEPDSVIKSGTGIEALREYYRMQKLAEKNPAYRVQLERMRDGLRGKTNVKRNDRSANKKEDIETFDPVEVEAKVKEVFGDNYTVEDFIGEFGDLETIKRNSRRSMLADEKAGTTTRRQAQSERLEKAEEVFDIFDEHMSDEVDDIDDSLQQAIDTIRGITQKEFSITPSVIEDLTQKYWARALEAYYNISLDKANKKVLKEIAAGLNGASGPYQRVKNSKKSVYPFDVKKVLNELDTAKTDVPTFIKGLGNYGILETEALPRMNETDINWMMTLKDRIDYAADIIKIMDEEEAGRLKTFTVQIDNKLQPRIKALTKGPWYQALEVYYAAFQAAAGDEDQLEFVENVIAHGLLGDGDREEFNRTDDPLDAVKIIEVLTDNNVEPYGFCEQYANYAKNGTTYQVDINKVFKEAGADGQKKQKLLERLEGDKNVIKELTGNGIVLAGLPTVQQIERAIEAISSGKASAKKRVLGSSWKEILLGYYGAPEAERPALAQELELKRHIDMKKIDKSMAAMRKKITAQEIFDRYGSKTVYMSYISQAITDSFNVGDTKALAMIHDQLKQLIAIVTVLEGTDEKYAAELASLMQHVTRIHNAMKHSRDGYSLKKEDKKVAFAGLLFSNQWQDILLAYDIIYQCSQDINLPQEFRVALQQGIATVVNPGLKGEKTGWRRSKNTITYDVAQVIADIKATSMPIEEFIRVYNDIQKYRLTVVVLTMQEPLDIKSLRTEIERSKKAIAVFQKIDAGHAKALEQAAKSLDEALDSHAKKHPQPAASQGRSPMDDVD